MVNIDIAQLFTNVGYPVAMSVLFALYIRHQAEQARIEREKSNELITGFMHTLNEYNSKLETLTQQINQLFQKFGNQGGPY